jgi:hypothetical protein
MEVYVSAGLRVVEQREVPGWGPSGCVHTHRVAQAHPAYQVGICPDSFFYLDQVTLSCLQKASHQEAPVYRSPGDTSLEEDYKHSRANYAPMLSETFLMDPKLPFRIAASWHQPK